MVRDPFHRAGTPSRAGRHVLRLAACLLAIGGLFGCLAEPTRVEGDGGSWKFQPGVRVTVNFPRDDRAPASETQSGFAVEVGYQHNTVSSNQYVPAGAQPVVLGSTAFYSPVQLRNQFDFSYTEISFRQREFIQYSPIGLEWNVGMGEAHFGETVSSAAQQAARSYSTDMVQVGLGTFWRLDPHSSLHLRAAGAFSFGTGVTEIERGELYYAWAFHNNFALQAGYADWHVRGTGPSYDSGFLLHMGGPLLRLEGSTDW